MTRKYFKNVNAESAANPLWPEDASRENSGARACTGAQSPVRQDAKQSFYDNAPYVSEYGLNFSRDNEPKRAQPQTAQIPTELPVHSVVCAR